jgi:hypothetical protein
MTELVIDVEITDATQYASVYIGEGAVATLRRQHSFDPPGSPRWELFNLHGDRIRVWRLPRSYEGLKYDIQRTLLNDPSAVL